MKFVDAREAFYEASQTTSDTVRQLSFAGIAVVWILKPASGPGMQGSGLLLPLALFCSTLILDLLQYVYKTVIWEIVTKRAGDIPASEIDSCEVDTNTWYNRVTDILWWSKIGVLAIGYIVLGKYFLKIS